MIKKITKRIIAIIMVLSFAITGQKNAEAAENTKKHYDETLINLSNQNQLDDISCNAEIVVLDNLELNALNYDSVNELLDDGITIYDMKSSEKDIETYFSSVDTESTKNTIGYQVTKEGTDVIITPIDVEIAYENDTEKSTEDYERLVAEAKITTDDFETLNQKEDILHIDEATDEFIALIQASSSIGDAFASSKRKTFFYRKHWYDLSTAALGSSESPESGWSKLGFATVTLYAYAAGGTDSVRYDAFFTNVVIGGLNDYYLYGFTIQMRLYDQNNCDIIDYSHLKGDKDESVSTSIGGSLSANDKGLSAGFSKGYSYSYNPGGLGIKNTSGDSELQPNWICEKKWNDCEKNERYTLNPSILVYSPKGKTKITKVSARVKNIKIQSSSTFKGYKIANSSGKEYVYLEVKNHKKVQ